jgi:hypothetical protein
MAFPIRGLDPRVVDKLDAAAAERGLSRNAYIVEVLTEHARSARPTASPDSFAAAAALTSDLGDDELMRRAWT